MKEIEIIKDYVNSVTSKVYDKKISIVELTSQSNFRCMHIST